MTERIARVEAFELRMPPIGGTYWGKASWGQDTAGSVVPLSAEYPPVARRRYVYSDTIDCVLVRIETESGAVGWGEAKAPVGADATAAIVDRAAGADAGWRGSVAGTGALGADVSAMRVRGHSTGFWLEAISGVDIALWDLRARILV